MAPASGRLSRRERRQRRGVVAVDSEAGTGVAGTAAGGSGLASCSAKRFGVTGVAGSTGASGVGASTAQSDRGGRVALHLILLGRGVVAALLRLARRLVRARGDGAQQSGEGVRRRSGLLAPAAGERSCSAVMRGGAAVRSVVISLKFRRERWTARRTERWRRGMRMWCGTTPRSPGRCGRSSGSRRQAGSRRSA